MDLVAGTIPDGTVEMIGLAAASDTLASSPVTDVEVTFEGFTGDRHAGLIRAADGRVQHFPRGTPIRNTRQVSILCPRELAEIAKRMQIDRVEAEWLGANLVISGLPSLTALPPGTRLVFPAEATLVVEGENLPCIHPGRVIAGHYPDRDGLASRFPRAAMHLRGLVAWVERPGRIRVGDRVTVLVPAPCGQPPDMG